MNPQELKNQIIKELQIEHLAPEQQQRIISELSEIILQRITSLALAKVPESEMAQLDSLLEQGNQEAVRERLKQLVPDIEQIAQTVTQEAIEEFRALTASQGQEQEGEQNQAPFSQAQQQMPHTPQMTTPPQRTTSQTPDLIDEIDDPAKAAEFAAQLPPQPATDSDDFVVGEDGTAYPADKPLLGGDEPQQPAY